MIVGSPTILNLVPGGVNKVVHVNQVNDNIEIQFQIMNGSQPYNVTEGVSCTIRGTKGDSYGYTAEAATTVGSNVVTVTLTEQLTAVAGGCNVFELVFVGAENSMKVSTENFILAVERAALGEDTVISDSDLAYAEQVLDQLQSVGAVNAQVQQNKANLAAEISRAQTAEAAEAAARQAADNTLQSNINAEASTRATQDASLQSQINQLVAPSGSAPSAAEVENARVGADGTVYPTLGDAIRGQVTDVKSQIDAIGFYNLLITDVEDGSIDSTTGEPVTVGDRARTKNFIPAYKGMKIESNIPASLLFGVYIYDFVTLEFSSATGWNNTYVINEDCYIKLIWNTTNFTKQQCVDNTDLTYVQVHPVDIDYQALANKLKNTGDYVSNKSIIDGSVSVDKLGYDFLEKTRNLFLATFEKVMYNTSGERVVISTNAWATSTLIDVTESTEYTISWKNAKIADAGYIYLHYIKADGLRLPSGGYVSVQFTQHKYTFTTPENTKYLAVSHYLSGNTNWENLIPAGVQVELGAVKTDYISPIEIQTPYIPVESIKPNLTLFKSKTARTIGHRGNILEAPQNTAPSYIIARQSGIEIMENDLDITDDNHFVMWHDGYLHALGNLVDITGKLVYTDGTTYYYYDSSTSKLYTYASGSYAESSVSLASLTRCNGDYYAVRSGYTYGGHSCAALPFNVLRRIDFGAYKGARFNGTQILTFEEWLVLCKKLGCEVYIDKKLEYTNTLITNAANLVKNIGLASKASWLGMSVSEWATLRSIIPDARVGVLTNPTDQNVESYAPYNIGRGLFFDGSATNLTQASVHIGSSAGFEVECYYVGYRINQKTTVFDRINELLSWGIQGITLDKFTIEEATNDLIWSYQI